MLRCSAVPYAVVTFTLGVPVFTMLAVLGGGVVMMVFDFSDRLTPILVAEAIGEMLRFPVSAQTAFTDCRWLRPCVFGSLGPASRRSTFAMALVARRPIESVPGGDHGGRRVFLPHVPGPRLQS